MKDIAIYGFGGFGREIACVINAINQATPTWNFIGYFDDGHSVGEANKYGRVLGNMETVNQYNGSPLAIVMAIASPAVLQNITGKIHNPCIYFPKKLALPTFVSPDIRTSGCITLQSPIVTSCPNETQPFIRLKFPIVTPQLTLPPNVITFPCPIRIDSSSKKRTLGAIMLGK